MKIIKVIFFIFVFLNLTTFTVSAKVIVLTNLESPTTYIEDGEATGISYDIVNELLSHIESNTKIEIQPWARAYKTALNNPNVIIFSAGQTKKRKSEGFHFLGPLVTRNHAVYKKKFSGVKVSNIDDIRRQGLVVGGLREDWRTIYFEKEGITVDKANSHMHSVKKMLAGRFPLLIGSDIEFPQWVEESGCPIDFFEVAFIFKEAPSFIAISKGTDQYLINKMERAFKKMQRNNFFDFIANKYSARLSYQLKYSPAKGIFRP
ncbi:ABC transporter substrate-binding protein [Desulfovibrio sp. JC022]|uniref:substrate-binding periplasmic protein n=1 Tax=Desulfovibrio sp. JC022 TaxID=2593642 RepID=UPI0013D1DED0|nr:transporter substrate-binding domain-containing protein [Desulfovibrio sp. JC022]NDV24641.1 amino acid ABC transporter substrate-binding protein [Desulfovibrio sp. JC022]